jgi:dTDP-4-amino-4,6-dideoxygalactose transaminase
MPVPLLDLNRQNSPLHPELMTACERVLRSGHFIQGPEVEAFERECATALGAPHAIAVSSGTDALLVALMALDIGPGDEVIVPSFTFFATAGSVARLGATPVFADVCPACFNLDPADVARRITPRTKALIPVHLFGQSADLDALLALAKAHDLAIVEDAAQSFGAKYRDRCVGTLGDFGTFSFFPSKNLGGFGDGGLVTTHRAELAERVRLLRTHGAKPKYYHAEVGGNFRLDALQAALLRIKLPHRQAYAAARRANAAAYTAALLALPGVSTVAPSPSAPCACQGGSGSCPSAAFTSDARLIVPSAVTPGDHIWNQYTLRVPGPGRRDALKKHLTAAGIGTEIYYPLPLHQQKCFAHLPPVTLPVSEQLAAEVLSIPVFPELGEAERSLVQLELQRFQSKA